MELMTEGCLKQFYFFSLIMRSQHIFISQNFIIKTAIALLFLLILLDFVNYHQLNLFNWEIFFKYIQL